MSDPEKIDSSPTPGPSPQISVESIKLCEEGEENLSWAWKKRVVRLASHRMTRMERWKMVDRNSYSYVIKTVQEKRLFMAAATNNIELLEWLLKKGVNPNIRDSVKRSPLHISACGGYIEVVKLLVKHGANPNIRDIMDNTPLHLAACTSNVPIVIALLDAGTDVSSLNTNGMSPLQLAQSKLRLIQQLPSSAETAKLKDEVQLIGEMMHKFLKTDASEMDALNERLKNMNTREEVENEVQSLLNNLSSLSLQSK